MEISLDASVLIPFGTVRVLYIPSTIWEPYFSTGVRGALGGRIDGAGAGTRLAIVIVRGYYLYVLRWRTGRDSATLARTWAPPKEGDKIPAKTRGCSTIKINTLWGG